MRPFKKYVTCIMAFFTPFNYLSRFVDFTLTLPLCYSLNFTKKLYNERKENFFVYGCFSLSRYIKGGKKSHTETQLSFWTHMLYKQPTLTNGGIIIFSCNSTQLFQVHWQALSWMCFFCCLMQGYHFCDCKPSFLCHFVLLSSSTHSPFSKSRT